MGSCHSGTTAPDTQLTGLQLLLHAVVGFTAILCGQRLGRRQMAVSTIQAKKPSTRIATINTIGQPPKAFSRFWWIS